MYVVLFFFLMIRRPPRSTRMTHSFPTRRSSDLAKKGEAARALSAAFASSMIGGVFGAVVLTGAVLVARPIVLAFGTGEMLMLSVIGITMVGVLTGQSALKGLLSALIGVMIAMNGIAPATSDRKSTSLTSSH